MVRVTASAVLYVPYLVTGRVRHHQLIRYAIKQGLSNGSQDPILQGFLTSEGEFVTRKVAARIAKAAGQVQKLIAAPMLYSEDLWEGPLEGAITVRLLEGEAKSHFSQG